MKILQIDAVTNFSQPEEVQQSVWGLIPQFSETMLLTCIAGIRGPKAMP